MQSNSAGAVWRRVVWLLGLAAVAGFSSAVRAQGWVAGGAVGTGAQQKYVVAGTVSAFEDEDSGYRVFGAYMVSPRQGLVGSYIDLGTTYYEGTAMSAFRDELEVTGIDMSYIAGWAPGSQQRISLFGTVGLIVWDQMVTHADAGGTVRFSDDGTSFSMGGGAEIRFGRNGSSPWGVHMGWQLFKSVGNAQTSGHKYDRELLSIGASYRFGRRYE